MEASLAARLQDWTNKNIMKVKPQNSVLDRELDTGVSKKGPWLYQWKGCKLQARYSTVETQGNENVRMSSPDCREANIWFCGKNCTADFRWMGYKVGCKVDLELSKPDIEEFYCEVAKFVLFRREDTTCYANHRVTCETWQFFCPLVLICAWKIYFCFM